MGKNGGRVAKYDTTGARRNNVSNDEGESEGEGNMTPTCLLRSTPSRLVGRRRSSQALIVYADAHENNPPEQGPATISTTNLSCISSDERQAFTTSTASSPARDGTTQITSCVATG